MQEGTLKRPFDGHTLHVETKSGAVQSHRLDDTIKITVEPVGSIDDIVVGDLVKFSGSPPTEVIIYRQHVAPGRQAEPSPEALQQAIHQVATAPTIIKKPIKPKR